MKAYIVTLYRYNDSGCALNATTILLADNEKDLNVAIASLFPGHGVADCEPAPWLDKPADTTHATPQAVGELVAAPQSLQSLPIYEPAGYKFVPIEPSWETLDAGRTALLGIIARNTGIHTRDMQSIWSSILEAL